MMEDVVEDGTSGREDGDLQVTGVPKGSDTHRDERSGRTSFVPQGTEGRRRGGR